nr:DUF4956 domain-containing protein [Bacteroidota bacterium]
MEQEFFTIHKVPTTIEDVLSSIVVAFVGGLLIALFYKITYKGSGYPKSFLFSLITLCMVTTIVILVIGNNLATAFGLVGAMSLIRFRTAVKDTQDIMFLFFALAIGMTCGVQLYGVALASTILIGFILILLSKTNVIFVKSTKYLLQFHYIFNEEEKTPTYIPVLNKYCRKNRLINSKVLGDTDAMEFSFYVELKNTKFSNNLLQDLKHSSGVSYAHLFFEDDHL